MVELSQLIVRPDASILEAIRCIDGGGSQIALIVDGDGRLLGTVTDGDVRRAILKGIGVEQPVSGIMQSKPLTLPADATEGELMHAMREKELHQVPLIDQEGRVTALRTLDQLIRGRRKPNLVVLMAGGLGTRLRPLTDATPKPMLPVGGRPLLETIITSFVEQGFQRFAVSLNYNGHLIRSHFGDGSRFDAEISYIEEPDRMGTAGSLALLPDRPEEPFLVMNGDILTSVNFSQMLDFHSETGAAGTMAVYEHSLQVPYGVVEVSGHDLKDITEKPVHRFFINAGIYALEPAALSHIPAGTFYDMPELFRSLQKEGAGTAAFPIREYWLDIGQPHDLDRAQQDYEDIFGKGS